MAPRDFDTNQTVYYMKALKEVQGHQNELYMKALKEFQRQMERFLHERFSEQLKCVYMKTLKNFQDNWATSYMK